jgi:hypothetical protein
MSSVPPPLNRRTSTASGAALSLLDALEAEIANLEAQNAALERLVAEAGENPGEEGVAVLIEKRNELRQHCGNLEKVRGGGGGGVGGGLASLSSEVREWTAGPFTYRSLL